jgi:hypothetical protein
MVKKSIIAIAMLSLLASVSFAADPFPGAPDGQIKIDGSWPSYQPDPVYEVLEICKVNVKIKVGMFLETDACNKTIVMKQVSCSGNHGFPCYKGCIDIWFRSNFDATISLDTSKIGDIISGGWGGDNWDVYFYDGSDESDTFDVVGDGNKKNIKLCSEAWDANIYKANPGDTVKVGEITLLAMPTAAP